MAKTYPVIERAGGRITVLARTAEEAHEAVSRELGSGCSIVSVERVRSGGLGGFFATELVRLVAAPRRINAGAAEAPSFASAEDLVFALPGGGGQFAARLQEELAALTTKGVAAAEATMGRTAPAPLPPKGREHFDDDLTVAAWSTVTEPVARIAPEPSAPAPATTHAVEPEPILPSPDDLHWATAEEAPHRWRRSRGDRTGNDVGLHEDLPEPTLSPVDDAALFAAWNEVAMQADEPSHTDFGAVQPTAATPPAPVWEALPSDPDEALMAQMLATELEIEDRAITPRARLIRGGIRSVVDTSSSEREPLPDDQSVTAFPSPTLESDVAVAEPEVSSAVGEPPPVSDTPPPSSPRPGAPVEPSLRVEPERAPLPVRHRVLVPTPVAPAGCWSAPTLRAFGVPDGIVDRMTAQLPVDDVEWTVAFMLSVRDLCRHMPAGPNVLVGPSGANLARQLGLLSCSGDELQASNLSVASPNAGPVTLRRSVAGRHVHLVVGGNWHHLVTVRPTIVSASTEHDLLEALRVAEAWGACLGWTLDNGRYVRIDPYLLAGRVRGLLPDRAEMSAGIDTDLFPLID